MTLALSVLGTIAGLIGLGLALWTFVHDRLAGGRAELVVQHTVTLKPWLEAMDRPPREEHRMVITNLGRGSARDIKVELFQDVDGKKPAPLLDASDLAWLHGGRTYGFYLLNRTHVFIYRVDLSWNDARRSRQHVSHLIHPTPLISA